MLTGQLDVGKRKERKHGGPWNGSPPVRPARSRHISLVHPKPGDSDRPRLEPTTVIPGSSSRFTLPATNGAVAPAARLIRCASSCVRPPGSASVSYMACRTQMDADQPALSNPVVRPLPWAFEGPATQAHRLRRCAPYHHDRPDRPTAQLGRRTLSLSRAGGRRPAAARRAKEHRWGSLSRSVTSRSARCRASRMLHNRCKTSVD